MYRQVSTCPYIRGISISSPEPQKPNPEGYLNIILKLKSRVTQNELRGLRRGEDAGQACSPHREESIGERRGQSGIEHRQHVDAAGPVLEQDVSVGTTG